MKALSKTSCDIEWDCPQLENQFTIMRRNSSKDEWEELGNTNTGQFLVEDDPDYSNCEYQINSKYSSEPFLMSFSM